jgi:hypothetical protein
LIDGDAVADEVEVVDGGVDDAPAGGVFVLGLGPVPFGGDLPVVKLIAGGEFVDL